MSTNQYLDEFVSKRLPKDCSLSDFYSSAGDLSEKMHDIANRIMTLEAEKATAPDSANTKSYEELDQERKQTMAHIDLASSQTEREKLERDLDNLQRQMEARGKEQEDKTQVEIGQAIDELEQLVAQVCDKLR